MKYSIMMSERNDVKISVIIPVYNCEDYIEECLQSVIRQSCKDIEVLCIDDGSADRSADIIETMKKCDSRIRLFRQKNQGAGSARNLGIRQAKGEYLAFLDADDYYLDRDALKIMYDLSKEKGVPVCGGRFWKFENQKMREEKLFHQDFYVGNFDEKIYQYEDFQIDYGYTCFLFDHRLFQDGKLFFPDYRRFQDPPFLVRAMYAAGRFTVADVDLYCYRVPNMPNRFTTDKVKDLIRGLSDNLQFASENGLNLLFDKTLTRLEYEYADIICHNLETDRTELLELLLNANKIAAQGVYKEKYIIRPLQKLLEYAVCADAEYEKHLLEWLKKQNQFAIYGAGKLAKAFLRYLERNEMRESVSVIVVSALTDNEASLEGIPVIEAGAFGKQDEFLLVAVNGGFHKEIEDLFHDLGYEKYLLLSDVFLNALP